VVRDRLADAAQHGAGVVACAKEAPVEPVAHPAVDGQRHERDRQRAERRRERVVAPEHAHREPPGEPHGDDEGHRQGAEERGVDRGAADDDVEVEEPVAQDADREAERNEQRAECGADAERGLERLEPFRVERQRRRQRRDREQERHAERGDDAVHRPADALAVLEPALAVAAQQARHRAGAEQQRGHEEAGGGNEQGRERRGDAHGAQSRPGRELSEGRDRRAGGDQHGDREPRLAREARAEAARHAPPEPRGQQPGGERHRRGRHRGARRPRSEQRGQGHGEADHRVQAPGPRPVDRLRPCPDHRPRTREDEREVEQQRGEGRTDRGEGEDRREQSGVRAPGGLEAAAGGLGAQHRDEQVGRGRRRAQQAEHRGARVGGAAQPHEEADRAPRDRRSGEKQRQGRAARGVVGRLHRHDRVEHRAVALQAVDEGVAGAHRARLNGERALGVGRHGTHRQNAVADPDARARRGAAGMHLDHPAGRRATPDAEADARRAPHGERVVGGPRHAGPGRPGAAQLDADRVAGARRDQRDRREQQRGASRREAARRGGWSGRGGVHGGARL